MKLNFVYPTKAKDFNPNALHGLPDKQGNPSGYLVIAAIKSPSDVYVCFTDKEKEEVWIEKTSKIIDVGQICSNNMVRIDNEHEFNNVHQFLVNEGILDGIKNS